MLVLSTGQIRDEIQKETGLHLDRDAVAYAIRKLGIEPIGRAGLVRLFAPDAVEKVRDFLKLKRRKEVAQCAG